MTVDFARELQLIHISHDLQLTLLYAAWPLQGRQEQLIAPTALAYLMHPISVNGLQTSTPYQLLSSIKCQVPANL